MPRPPFDPSKMAAKREPTSLFAAPPSPPAPPATPAPNPASSPGVSPSPAPKPDRPLTVSQLCSLVDTTLRASLPPKLRVVGEISGFNNRTHWYFSLKDADAVMSCVMFAGAARSVRFQPENGHEVVATGRIEFFAKQGRTQFYVEKIEPVGAGALDLEFRRLCDELRAKGWFDVSRKRPLPSFPRRLAVVTSRTSAAWQDVLNTVSRRCPAVSLSLCDVRVQGDGAAREIVRTLRWLAASHTSLGIDAILLTRGGGSKEDLWSFNDPALAEAIVAAPIPVVAAIGHETDTTIAELVADERCATPTQAAMRLTPDSLALEEQLESTAARLRSITTRHLREARRRVESAARSPTIARPARLLERRVQTLDHLAQRVEHHLGTAIHERTILLERLSARLEVHRPAATFARRATALERVTGALHAAVRSRFQPYALDAAADRLARAADHRLDTITTHLASLDRALDLVGPASVLRRGYSMTLGPDGAAIRSVADARPGAAITTVVADGSFTSNVVGDAGDAAPLTPEALREAARRQQQHASLPRPARLKAKRPDDPPDQLKLFQGYS